MTNEFDPHSPESEGQPGSLGDAFGGFMPDMPEGSWDRLNERRKKRRRGFLWWLFPALLLSVGAYWLIQKDKSAEAMLATTQPESHVSKEISTARTSVSKAEKNTEAKTSEPTERKQPSGISDESERTINPQAESTEDRTASNLASKEKTYELAEVKKSNEKPIASNLSIIPTKKKRTRKLSDTKSGFEIAKSSPCVEMKEAAQNQLASKDFRSESNAQIRKKESASSTVSALKLNEGGEELIAQKPHITKDEVTDSNLPAENQKSTDANVVAQSVSPKDSIGSKIDFVALQKVDSTSNLSITPKDSVRRELAKRKFGFELGLSGLYVQHQLSVQSAEQTGSEQVLQSPVSVRPVFGGNLQFKMRVPMGSKFALLPLLETSVLHRRMTFQTEPGPSALVKLIQTADGISGAPVLQPGTYSKETDYLLPGAGLEASYALIGSLELRAGAVWSWVFTNKQEQKPRLIQPAYWLAAQYHLQRRWSIRSEIRRMDMSARLLPSASSNSRNLFLGFGFVRSW